MSILYRKVFERVYKERHIFNPFLSRWFSTSPSDISDAETMQIEVKRSNSGYIASVIMDMTQEGALIKDSVHTRKEFTPPITSLGTRISAKDAIVKQFGDTEYDNPAYGLVIVNKIAEIVAEIERRFNYQIEYQASQILQTGTVTLYDEKGVAAFTISFQPKATHFPTVSTNWSDENSDPDADITALSKVIRQDGQIKITNLVFGETALINYLNNAKTADKFDVRRYEMGTYAPKEQNEDVDLLGDIVIGTKRYKCWKYDGEYKSPVALAGTLTPFVADDKVLFLPDQGNINLDFRRKYLTIPTLVGVENGAERFLPGNMMFGDRAYTVKAYLDKPSDSFVLDLKNRQMLIPVSIDAFGCLDTEI